MDLTKELPAWTIVAAKEIYRPADVDEAMINSTAQIIAAFCPVAPLESTPSGLQRGDATVGRTIDDPHHPLVCFVCGGSFPVTFNFCLEHKDEYERLKVAVKEWGEKISLIYDNLNVKGYVAKTKSWRDLGLADENNNISFPKGTE